MEVVRCIVYGHDVDPISTYLPKAHQTEEYNDWLNIFRPGDESSLRRMHAQQEGLDMKLRMRHSGHSISGAYIIITAVLQSCRLKLNINFKTVTGETALHLLFRLAAFEWSKKNSINLLHCREMTDKVLPLQSRRVLPEDDMMVFIKKFLKCPSLDLSIKDNYNWTVLDWARSSRCKKIERLILEHAYTEQKITPSVDTTATTTKVEAPNSISPNATRCNHMRSPRPHYLPMITEWYLSTNKDPKFISDGYLRKLFPPESNPGPIITPRHIDPEPVVSRTCDKLDKLGLHDLAGLFQDCSDSEITNLAKQLPLTTNCVFCGHPSPVPVLDAEVYDEESNGNSGSENGSGDAGYGGVGVGGGETPLTIVLAQGGRGNNPAILGEHKVLQAGAQEDREEISPRNVEGNKGSSVANTSLLKITPRQRPSWLWMKSWLEWLVRKFVEFSPFLVVIAYYAYKG